MFQFLLNPFTFVTTSHSKSSASTSECEMYTPLAEALNYALESLSDVRVDGLPEFKAHIVFVPCDKGVPSNRNRPGSSFKPDITVLPLTDARNFYELDKLDTPNVSHFISEIDGKSPPGFASWKTILSVVEVKRKKDMSGWALLEAIDYGDGCITQDLDQRLNEELDTSQSTTREVNPLS